MGAASATAEELDILARMVGEKKSRAMHHGALLMAFEIQKKKQLNLLI